MATSPPSRPAGKRRSRPCGSDPSIAEVILSGGDPLSLSNRRLREFSNLLMTVPHVRRVTNPHPLSRGAPGSSRRGSALIWLDQLPIQRVIVIHANHPREIDGQVADACRALAGVGATMLNQSVLLAGVNDDADTLVELSERLFAAGVLPYYLHVLDKVQGAAHFDLPVARALELHSQIASRLPGYLVPRLVREVAGAPSKMPIRAQDSGHDHS